MAWEHGWIDGVEIPRIKREKYSAPRLVVPSWTPVARKFSMLAAHSPHLRPSLELNGPTSSEPTNVPMVIRLEMSCCTVGSMAQVRLASS
jgi:hypothetical protein